MSMTSEQIAVIAAMVLAAVQLVKWTGRVADGQGPLVVLSASFIGVLLFHVSNAPPGTLFDRLDLWPLATAWITVATSAGGVYGFVRAAPETFASFSNPTYAGPQTPITPETNPPNVRP